eukprot:jgi/Tetstr1/450322/TSEL_037358.t1
MQQRSGPSSGPHSRDKTVLPKHQQGPHSRAVQDLVTCILDGDTVTFVPTDPTHNAETILGMLPEGAEAFKGKINEQISVTFEEEGLYGYKCAPHFGLGMIGLIEVGDSETNAAEAQNVTMPPAAQERMAVLFEQALSGSEGSNQDN